MESQTIFELIGYSASILIAISLVMKSLLRLRIFNAIGAFVFVIYGILIKAFPISILNGLIVIIDAYYLIKMLKRSEYFSLMEVSVNSSYLHFFLNFHIDDIRNFFPKFAYTPETDDLIFFILRDTIPAGLIIIRPKEQSGQVLLDYALKDYRDLKIGAFIFDDNTDLLINRGIQYLETKGMVVSHVHYLEIMGFKHSNDHLYQKDLGEHFIDDQNI